MVPIQGLFEAHLTVRNLDQSMKFFESTLGLKLAAAFPDRRAAFFWIGEPGGAMVGIWETGDGPQRVSLHIAFSVSLAHILDAPERLKASGLKPLDFWEAPTDEPVVLAWMPAASLYFHDPDGNLLEFLAMLPDAPCPEKGIVSWSRWCEMRGESAGRAGDARPHSREPWVVRK